MQRVQHGQADDPSRRRVRPAARIRFRRRGVVPEERREQDEPVRQCAVRAAGKAHDEPAAGGMAAEDHLVEGVAGFHEGDQVGKVVLELADVVDVAAPLGIRPVPAQIGDDDRAQTPSGQSPRHCVELHPVPAGAVDQDNQPARGGRAFIAAEMQR